MEIVYVARIPKSTRTQEEAMDREKMMLLSCDKTGLPPYVAAAIVTMAADPRGRGMSFQELVQRHEFLEWYGTPGKRVLFERWGRPGAGSRTLEVRVTRVHPDLPGFVLEGEAVGDDGKPIPVVMNHGKNGRVRSPVEFMVRRALEAGKRIRRELEGMEARHAEELAALIVRHDKEMGELRKQLAEIDEKNAVACDCILRRGGAV